MGSDDGVDPDWEAEVVLEGCCEAGKVEVVSSLSSLRSLNESLFSI